MALTIKALAAGNRSATGAADLYTVPADKSAVAYSLRLVNIGANQQTINLYAKPSGLTARRIYEKDYALAANALLLDEDVVTLATGDKIQINISGTSPNVDFQINGIERDE